MLDKLTKLASTIPLIAVAIYIIGYVSLISYLQSYGISENIGLDFKVLKLGILLTIIIGPVILLAFADFKFDDYSNAEPDVSETLIHTLHDAYGYTILYTLALCFILIKRNFEHSTIVLLIIMFFALLLNKIKINSRYIKTLKGSYLMISFFIFCLLITWQTITPVATLCLLQLSVFMFCMVLRIFNKRGQVFQLSRIGSIVTVTFSTAALFGAFLVGNIPEQYGGERKTLITYHIVSSDVNKLKETALKYYLTNDNTLNVQEIYQGSELLYFKTSFNKIVALPKTYIESEEISIPGGYPKDHY